MTESTAKKMRDPLSGLRVVDFTSMMAGPLSTRMLADLGAEIIKIESPQGDHIRTQPPQRDGHSAYFGHLNCGKQSVVLDLKNPQGVELARKLAAAADVVVENSRPGVMERLGLGYEKLSALNSRLIYCSISGFGQTGPNAQRAAYAQVVQAASGFDLAQMSYLEIDRPPNVGLFTADVLAGIYAANAIQAAIIQRYESGEGQHLDVTLMECMFNLLIYEMQEAQFPAERRRNVYRPVKTQNGFLMIVIVSQTNFVNLAKAVGHPEWLEDARFATVPGRLKNWNDLMAAIEEWSEQRSLEECESVMNKAGVPCSRYHTPREALNDAAMRERGAFAEVEDGAGRFLVPNLPFRMSSGGAKARPFVPALGQHTESLLKDILGVDAAGMAKLRAQGAFGKR